MDVQHHLYLRVLLWIIIGCFVYIHGKNFDCSNLTSCPANPTRCKATISRDYLWLVGDTLSWNCTLSGDCTNLTSADINFCHRGNVPNNLTRIINQNTKELQIKEVTLSDSGSYFCYVDGCLAGDIEMKIGHPPEPPDVKMIYSIMSDVYSEFKVVATPKPINQGVNWKWDIRYKISPNRYFMGERCLGFCNLQAGLPFPCGCPAMKNSNCNLVNSGIDLCFMTGRFYMYTFNVKMWSDFGVAETQRNVTITNEIGRAPPVRNLSSNSSSHNSNISWIMWSLFTKDVVYRLYYRNAHNNTWQGPFETDFNRSCIISGLRPVTEYEVKVETKMSKSPYWGMPETISFKTLEDAPAESPKLSKGSYMFVSKPSTDCDSNLPSLYLYTKEIPPDKQNGNLTEMVLDITPQFTNETSRVIKPSYNNTVVLCGVEGDKGYTILVRAKTNAGTSAKPSEIIIPRSSVAPDEPVHVVAEKTDDDTVNVSWLMQSAITQPHNFTVHFCRLADRVSALKKCQEGYDWRTISGPQLSYNVTVPNNDHLGDLSFGVSIEKGGVSSGISWSNCLYDRSSVVASVSKFQVHSSHKKVNVKWSPPICQQRTGYPTSYQLRYGLIHKEEENSTSLCDRNSGDHDHDVKVYISRSCKLGLEGTYSCNTSVDNLEPSEWYYVCVRGISANGYGLWTYPEQWRADNDVTAAIVGGILGAFVVVVIIALLIWCIRRKWKEIEFKVVVPEDDTRFMTGSTSLNGYETVPNGVCYSNGIHSNGGFNTFSAPTMENGFLTRGLDSPGTDSPEPHYPVPDSPGPDSPVHHHSDTPEPDSPEFHLSAHELLKQDSPAPLSGANWLPEEESVLNPIPKEESPVLKSSTSRQNSPRLHPNLDVSSEPNSPRLEPSEQDSVVLSSPPPDSDSDDDKDSDDDDDDDDGDNYKSFPINDPNDSFAKMSEDMWKTADNQKNKEKGSKIRAEESSGKPASRSNRATQYSKFSDIKNGRTSSNSSEDSSDIAMVITEQSKNNLVRKEEALKRHVTSDKNEAEISQTVQTFV